MLNEGKIFKDTCMLIIMIVVKGENYVRGGFVASTGSEGKEIGLIVQVA
jgi:hypothetical protein